MTFKNRDIYVDVDGTLANTDWRQHFLKVTPRNWTAFFENMIDDPPYSDMIWLVQTLALAGNRILICTGRTSEYKKVTSDWLNKNGVPFDEIYMRAPGDYRDDEVVKLELVDQMRAQGFDPTIALEDRNKVVEALRKSGMRVLHVQNGNF